MSLRVDLRRYWHAWTQAYEQNLPQFEVTLNVHPDAVKHLSYHTSSDLDKFASATGWRELTVTFENPDHALAVLVTVAAHVEIVAPAELRQKWFAVARAMLEPSQIR